MGKGIKVNTMSYCMECEEGSCLTHCHECCENEITCQLTLTRVGGTLLDRVLLCNECAIDKGLYPGD